MELTFETQLEIAKLLGGIKACATFISMEETSVEHIKRIAQKIVVAEEKLELLLCFSPTTEKNENAGTHPNSV